MVVTPIAIVVLYMASPEPGNLIAGRLGEGSRLEVSGGISLPSLGLRVG